MNKKNKEYRVYKDVVIGLKRYIEKLDGEMIITPDNRLYDLVKLVYEFRRDGYLIPLILYGLEIEKKEEEFIVWNI